jgi:diguanylate cyclase (GGDEF)-like protein/putative nucleotidyltransferase with HDIG domain
LTMNNYSIVQFFTLLVYIILIAVVMRQEKTRPRNLFLVLLIASSVWSMSSFFAHADITRGQALFWIKLVPFGSMWVLVAYSHFVAAFVDKGTRGIGLLGYGYLLVLAVLIALGYIPKGVLPLGVSNIQPNYGLWMYFFDSFGLFFIGMAVWHLVQSYRASRSPEHRNRVVYLFMGLSVLAIFGSLYQVLPQQQFALDHIGHLGNALVITYTILKYQLLDIKLVVRKGLVYSSITVFTTAVYLIVVYSLQQFLGGWGSTAGLAAVIATAILVAGVFNPLRTFIQKSADRLFYGATYDYRQMILSFSQRMSSVLELRELAEAMLRPITKAVGANQASLLLPDENEFVSCFAERLVDGEPVISMKLPKDSPIVTWLTREDKPLQRDVIDVRQEFKALWESERRAISASEIELFFPMKSKDKLIGILAVSRKRLHGFYSNDDIDLLMTVAHEAAVVVENAQLYAQARERANTDELTGLFNHRYFHQRLDEEIARSSRFGHIFSLIFLDLDLFKTYNDVHGHLAGDDILSQVARHIKFTIRRTDIGVRYGGDEFAVILPQTSLDGARTLAERMRKRIEAQTDSISVPLTCSIGIACWPADGVMREEIVRSADAALYYAKQTGRNRICLASEVALSHALRVEVQPEAKAAILSTIYALAATVDAKDHHTYGHSKKVAKYATDIAEVLGYSEERMATIRAAALLHDIGKIGVSDRLLEKTGPLTPEDWEPIRAHPNLGVAILKHVNGLHECLAAVQYHHEHYDGSGYPAGLKGENIPQDARIMAVADAYDAMTSLRPYRSGKFTHEQAVAELVRCSGTQFDPVIVEAFASLDRQPTSTVRGSMAESSAY